MPSSPQIKPYTVSKRHHQTEIARFLADSMQISVRKAKGLLDNKSVWVNNKRVWMARHRLSTGDKVEVRIVELPPGASTKMNVRVAYEDAYLIAVTKPAGWVSESHKRSLESVLRKTREDERIRALHRLDKETSGLMLFTKGGVERDPYVQLFREHEITKQYAVLLAGTLEKKPMVIDQRLDGKDAHTAFHEVKRNKGFCRAECTIRTGRTHQIRRHAIAAGCRVLGDTRYKGGPVPTSFEKRVPRQMLHAERLQFMCPHTGASLDIQAPWPEDFTRATQDLGVA